MFWTIVLALIFVFYILPLIFAGAMYILMLFVPLYEAIIATVQKIGMLVHMFIQKLDDILKNKPSQKIKSINSFFKKTLIIWRDNFWKVFLISTVIGIVLMKGISEDSVLYFVGLFILMANMYLFVWVAIVFIVRSLEKLMQKAKDYLTTYKKSTI